MKAEEKAEGKRKLDLQKKYREDAGLRRYVDRYASGYQSGGRIPVEEALRHRIVRLVAEEREEDESNFEISGE
ncbi:MAG: hypothetical protein NC432_08715 [Roseburia sp.]|nr:hypothetical protein [Roseburia sp.]MCM1097805.1 hypothetical protein [Ruminococcus flavefaciens]